MLEVQMLEAGINYPNFPQAYIKFYMPSLLSVV